MYDVRGHMILNRSFPAGSNGGKLNRNQWLFPSMILTDLGYRMVFILCVNYQW